MTDGGTDAGFQFGQAEGFGHVVVGSLVERRHLAVLRADGGKYNDRHVVPLVDPPAYLQAVDVG